MLRLLLISTAAPRAAPLDASPRARQTRRNILGCGSAIGIIAAAANAVPPPKTNVTEALAKNKVVVRRQDLLTEVVIDPKTGDELREIQLPAGYPKSLRPPRLVERRVSEAELALAAVVAGGTTEIARVAALHPLATLKSRAQARPGTGPLALIDADGNGIIEPREVKDLYAGLVPSVSAAARARSASCFWGRVDGVPLYHVDGVPLRAVEATPRRWRTAPRRRGDVDGVAPHTINTTVRRRGEEVATTTAEAAAVGFRRWPTLFAAELPYSLLRILGLAALDATTPTKGGVLDATARTVAVAVVAALLTTPLDVARTRVLLRTAPGAAESGPPALAATLAEVAAEGSLFSGAALRVAYTGVVVAASIPLRTLFYVGLRDWIILDEVFQFDAIT
ncbi:unnamed protein product [Pelagomonas calceolata]|uniref:Calmodulin n=1 Tax=Pelagomonas calceolata TaxID=35677 RepID=A0A8J2S473_9STRA|nr:unnamed protein product [Pelagomonas calceolata]